MGLLVPLALILVAATLISSGPSLSPIHGGSPGPTRTVTIAQTATVAGLQLTLSLNSIRVGPASACEYSTPPPGTRRTTADVTLIPVGSPGFVPALQIFSRVDTGEYRYSLRLPDDGPGDSPPAGGAKQAAVLAERDGTPGTTYSLEPFSNGLRARIVCERIDAATPPAS